MIRRHLVRRSWASLAFAAGCGMQPNLPDEGGEPVEDRPVVRDPDPVDVAEPGQSANLLQHYIARDQDPDASARFVVPTGAALEAEAKAWTLPFKSKRMVAALLTTAARDRLGDLRTIMAPDARWGLPDARMMSARPVFGGDGGEAFFDALQAAASRFEHPARYVNATAFELGVQERLRTGAEPMWAYYDGGLDRILFRFRVVGGKAWIDYVGLFEERPTQAQQVRGKGPPPPMSPPIRTPDGRIVPTRTGGDPSRTVRGSVNPR